MERRKLKTKMFGGEERKIGSEKSEAVSVSAAPPLFRRQRSHSAFGPCQYRRAWFQRGRFFCCYAVDPQMENNSKRLPLPAINFFRLLFTAQHTIHVLYEL